MASTRWGWAIGILAMVVGVRSDDSTVPQWPQFRGPGGSGIAASGFPIHFGPDSNLVWKAELPSGHSSPCVWNDRIFLTGFSDGQLEVVALNRSDGSRVWQRQIQPGPIERGARLGSPATATPVTDGQRVYVYFGSFGLVCYRFDGTELWRKPLPVPVTQHGAGTSPVLAGDLLILVCDQDVGSHLLAVDKFSGETRWNRPRPEFRRGFSTPLLWPIQRPELAIVNGTLQMVAYRITDGSEVWRVQGLPNEMVTSPVAGGGLVYAAGWTPGAGVNHLPSFAALLELGDRNFDKKLTRDEAPNGPAKQHFVYIDADKDSFVTETEWDSIASIFGRSKNSLLALDPSGRGNLSEVRWSANRGLPYCSSPLYYEGRIYLIKNGGLMSCFDGETGQAHYLEERIGAMGDYYSSPVAGGGRVCVISQPGTAVVIKAGDTLEVLARNPLGSSVMATPAIVQGAIYIRTETGLWAFGEANPASVTKVEK